MGSLLDAWPARRRVAVAVLVPVLATWFVVVGRSSAHGQSAGWYVVTLLAGLLAAVVLATYVPAAGRRLDLGCTPCAAVSAFTVVGATLVLRGYGPDVTGPLLSTAILLFGLVQRLNQPSTCAVEPPPGRSRPGSDPASRPSADGATDRR